MLTPERQRILLDHIRSRGVGTVNELAKQLGVSPSTVRRDMKAMNAQGLLTRIHGGAHLPDGPAEPPRITRASVNRERKRLIARAGAALIPDGTTVLITGGTTTEAMIPFLTQRALTVLTNSVSLAAALTSSTHITVIVLGGVLRHEESSLLGPVPEQVLGEFDVDMAVVGAYGFDPRTGTYGADVGEAGTDRQLLRACPSVTVLVDSSKFGQRGTVKILPIDEISTVVTDEGVAAESAATLRERNVELLVARPIPDGPHDQMSTT